jgi:hypothetical protein
LKMGKYNFPLFMTSTGLSFAINSAKRLVTKSVKKTYKEIYALLLAIKFCTRRTCKSLSLNPSKRPFATHTSLLSKSILGSITVYIRSPTRPKIRPRRLKTYIVPNTTG